MSHLTSFDGTCLALTASGPPDAPVVVLVHGLGLSTGSWGEVPARLADSHRVITYDLRGHGASGAAGRGGYGIQAHARDLAAVLASCVPEGGRAMLVGHSLGGGIILAAARSTGTDRIAAVVFAGSGGSGVTAPGLPAHGMHPAVAAALRRVWLGVLRGSARLGRRLRSMEWLADRLVRRIGVGPTAPPEVVARVRDSFLATRARALAATALASLSHDGVEFASSLTVPTLVLHGGADPEVPQEEVRTLVAALPDAQLVEFPGAGHMLPLTHGAEVADHVARWGCRVPGA
jgi:pimeloyl-ACP methyl ester carboxylesterase